MSNNYHLFDTSIKFLEASPDKIFCLKSSSQMLTISFRTPVFPACFEAIKSSRRSHKAFGLLGRKTPRPFFLFLSCSMNYKFFTVGSIILFLSTIINSKQDICFINNFQIFIFLFFSSKTRLCFFIVISCQRPWVHDTFYHQLSNHFHLCQPQHRQEKIARIYPLSHRYDHHAFHAKHADIGLQLSQY